MRKIIIIHVFVCTVFLNMSFAQVGALIGICAGTGCQVGGDYCTYQLFSSIWSFERKALDKKSNDGIKRIISLETQLMAGGIGSNEVSRITIQPRVRFNVGIFAMDFRYKGMYSNFSTLTNYQNSSTFWDSYKTYDWQIFALNFLNTKKLRLQTSLGMIIDERNTKRDSLGAVTVIYNSKQNKTFFEVTVGANYYFDEEDRNRIFFEIRNSPQMTRLYSHRTEYGLTYYRAIYNAPQLMIQGIANATYTRYFKNTNMFIIQAGIGINIM